MGARSKLPHPTLSQWERAFAFFSLSLWERAGVRCLAAAAISAVASCGTPTGCLANRYDAAPPQTRCLSGIQLPGNILKDTDPMSGSTAPVTVAE